MVNLKILEFRNVTYINSTILPRIWIQSENYFTERVEIEPGLSSPINLKTISEENFWNFNIILSK